MTTQLESLARPVTPWLPMTVGALRRLRAEVQRLRGRPPAPRMFGIDGAADDPETVPATGSTALERHRLEVLEDALAAARVVRPEGRAVVGSRITARESDGSRAVYVLVAPGQSQPGAGQISPDSPLGEALLGAQAGDRVRVAAPAGIRDVTILDVR